MTVSFEKYKKQEWKENPVLAQVKEMKKELDHLRTVLDKIESMALPLTALRMNSQLGGFPNPGHEIIKNEIKALTGWMDSLAESEVGIHALTMSDFNLPVLIGYATSRGNFVNEQIMKWHALNTVQTIAMREIALGLYGHKPK